MSNFVSSFRYAKENANNLFIHESPSLEPDSFEEIKPFLMKYSYRLLYIKRSKIFPLGRKDTGRSIFF